MMLTGRKIKPHSPYKITHKATKERLEEEDNIRWTENVQRCRKQDNWPLCKNSLSEHDLEHVIYSALTCMASDQARVSRFLRANHFHLLDQKLL